MIQRVLAARTTWDGMMGIVFAGFINLLRPLVTCFLGFVVYPDRRRLKRRKGVAYARRLRQMARQYSDGEMSLDQVTASVQGWVNHLCYGNTVGLRKALLGSILFTAPRGEPVHCVQGKPSERSRMRSDDGTPKRQ